MQSLSSTEQKWQKNVILEEYKYLESGTFYVFMWNTGFCVIYADHFMKKLENNETSVN